MYFVGLTCVRYLFVAFDTRMVEVLCCEFLYNIDLGITSPPQVMTFHRGHN